MEEQKLNINLAEGKHEVIIRNGEASKPVEIEGFDYNGIITCPVDFLKSKLPTLNIPTCTILIDREKRGIMLVVNENSSLKSSVTGKLEFTEEFTKFKINTGSSWISRDLGEFVKMNRTYFETLDSANELSAKLLHFKAKVEKSKEQKDDKKGNMLDHVEQVIHEINIPDKFNLEIPIFKGSKKTKIGIEVYINANDLSITLISPDAAEIIRKTRDEIIDELKEKIIAICPEIAVIEC